MTRQEINDFKFYVVSVLIQDYGMTEKEAYNAINESYLATVLIKDPEYAEHIAIETWAQDIYESLHNQQY